MSTRAWWWTGVVFVLAVAGGVVISLSRLQEAAPLRYRLDLTEKGAALETVTVYYLAADSLRLVPRERRVIADRARSKLVADLIAQLAEPEPSLVAPLPPGTQLLHYFESEGVGVLNFNQEVGSVEGDGIPQETEKLRAVVRTLSENLDGVESVRFLVLGRPLRRWGGHLDLAGRVEVGRW